MKYIVLGRSSLKISVIGLGFWQAGSRLWSNRGRSVNKIVYEIVEKAYSYGINFYDTAEIYGGGLSEKYLGEAIKKHGIREEVVIASKIAGYKWWFNSMVKSVKSINERLGTNVDLIQHHWPPPVYVPLCRVIHSLEKIIDQGLVSYYGLSNYNTQLLIRALECSKKYEPISNQIQYNLAYRVAERKLLEVMRRNNISLIAWSPLAKGALAGLRKPKTFAQRTDPVFHEAARDNELQETLDKIASKYNVSKTAIALAWIISHGGIPIPGTRNPSRIDEYVKAADIILSNTDLEELDRVSNKYIYKWGNDYSSLKINRYIPGILQYFAIKIIGGI